MPLDVWKENITAHVCVKLCQKSHVPQVVE